MTDEIDKLLASLRSQTENLLSEIVRDTEREALQQTALSIYSKVIELEKELEHSRQSGPALPRSSSPNGESAPQDSVAEEINKVARKLPKWAANQQQINSKILTRFLELRRQGVTKLTEREFAEKYGDQAEFHRSYPQMKTISPKNNGKVFDVRNGVVEIWEPVQSAVAKYEAAVLGDR